MTDTYKTISIDRAEIGMYVVKLDRSWLWTPWLCHRGLIRDRDDIHALRRAGVREMVIDVARGRDAAPEPECHLPAPHTPAEPANTAQVIDAPELADVATLREDAIAAVERLFDGILTGVLLDRPGLQRLVIGLMERLMEDDHRLLTLTFLEQMRRTNRSLHAHAVDTCVLAIVVGRACALSREDLMELGQGAILHDVGHLCLPPALQSKDWPYTPAEQLHVDQHPSVALALLTATTELSPACTRIIMEHHER